MPVSVGVVWPEALAADESLPISPAWPGSPSRPGSTGCGRATG